MHPSRAVPLVAWVALAAGATAVGLATVSAVRSVVADAPVRVLTSSEVDALLKDGEANLTPIATLAAANSLPVGADQGGQGVQLDSREAGYVETDRGSAVPTNADDSPSRLGQDPGTLNGDTGDARQRSDSDRGRADSGKSTKGPAPTSSPRPVTPGDPTPTPTPSETGRVPATRPTPSPTASPAPSASPSPTPSPSVSPSPTASPAPSPTGPIPPTPSATPSPTPSTSSPAPTASPTTPPHTALPSATPSVKATLPLAPDPAVESEQEQVAAAAVPGLAALAVVWVGRRPRGDR